MTDMSMNLDGLTAPELASLDDGSGDIYRAKADRRARLLRMLDPAEMRIALGVLLETYPEIFDEVAAAVPEAWHTSWRPEPPGSIEAVVADSVEHQGRYRNELRHLPATPCWRAVLTEHYLTGITCDHETKRDNPVCACSRVHLGWHSTIGAAVQAWLDHVSDLVVLREQP